MIYINYFAVFFSLPFFEDNFFTPIFVNCVHNLTNDATIFFVFDDKLQKNEHIDTERNASFCIVNLTEFSNRNKQREIVSK